MKPYQIRQAVCNGIKNLPNFFGDVVFEIKDYNEGVGSLEICVDGWYDNPYKIAVTHKTIKEILLWLEAILFSPDNEHTLIFSHYKEANHDLTFGYVPLNGFEGQYNEKDCEPVSLADCCYLFVYDEWNNRIIDKTFFLREQLVRRIYTTMKRDNNLHSKVIEFYYQKKEPIRLAYKGYYTIAEIEKTSLRYFGYIYSAKDNKKVEGWEYAADYYGELKPRFEDMVENIIECQSWDQKNKIWKNSGIDIDSIGIVFDILPEQFKQRIIDGIYDKSLTTNVPGGIYEVPLYYVTKAWDYILNGDLCSNDFRVEYDPVYDDPVDRTLEQAIADNNAMKEVWKELLNIDVDAIDVDFSKYDKHLPPNVSYQTSSDYFDDSINGISEWILNGINSPKGSCTFENVSCLMEFAAYIKIERQDRSL